MQEIEHIDDNIALNYYCSKNTTKFRKKLNINNIPIEVQNYVNNRYDDSLSLKETLYRMYHHLDIHPKCPICGKPVVFGSCGDSLHWHKTCKDSKCQHEICKQTMFKHFGYINVYQREDVKNKIKEQIKKHYGVEHALQSEELHQKQEQTCLKRFGVKNAYESPEIKNKIKKTCLDKYGVEHHMKLDIIKNKFDWNTITKKQHETKKKNGTYKKSNEEDKSYELLKEKYPDVIRQYRSELYPFNCDFYVPSINLYIECNYHWTHGGKLYEGTIEDNKLLQYWKDKNTKYYDRAIATWTNLDVRKYNIACKNKLNYKVFYNTNELRQWLN